VNRVAKCSRMVMLMSATYFMSVKTYLNVLSCGISQLLREASLMQLVMDTNIGL